MFRHLLVATDGEDGLERLGRCLDRLAAGSIEQVSFVQATEWQNTPGGMPTDPAPKLAAQEHQLRQHWDPAPEGLKLNVLVRIGQPVDVILKAIQQVQPDVLMLGMSVRNLLAEKLLGSTTMQLLPRLRIPALILRPQLLEVFTLEELRIRCQKPFHHLLLPCDLEDPAQPLLDRIVHLLEQHAAPTQLVTLLYVLDPSARKAQTSNVEQLRQGYELRLHQLAAAVRPRLPSIDVQTELCIGAPVAGILKVAAAEDVTAIAMASRHVGRLWEWSIPSSTGEVLRRSWHPVLLFPFEKPEV